MQHTIPTKLLSLSIILVNIRYVMVISTTNKTYQVPEKCLKVSTAFLDCSNLSLKYISTHKLVKFANLSYNNIGGGALDIRAMSAWSDLLSLDLTYNKISIFIGRGARIPLINNLNLSHNEIFDLKARMFTNMDNLKFLYLSSNRIALISPSAINLPNLIELDLRYNRLTTLRVHYFRGVPSLRKLYLSYNLISSIPDFVFFVCNSLSHLDVSFNRISRVSKKAFENVRKLDLMDLSFNSITRTISTSFTPKILAKRLLFNANQFGNLHSNAVHNINVQILEICATENMQYISDDSFIFLPLLKVLIIENNPNLRYISPNAFQEVPKLAELLLKNNNLFTIDAQIPLSFPNLSLLDLEENTLHCDCSMKWLQDVILNSTFRSEIRTNITDVMCLGDNVTLERISEMEIISNFCKPYLEMFANDIVSVDLSSNVSIKCASSGIHMPLIVWTHQNSSNTSVSDCPGRVCQQRGHLWITSVRDEDKGEYICSASNNFGESENSVRVNVQNLNVTLIATQVSSNYIALHWSIMKSKPIVNTCVFIYGELHSKFNLQSVLHKCHHHRFYTLVDLKSEVEYNVSMFKQHNGHLFKMDSITVRTRRESLMEMLTAHYTFLVLCAVVVMLISSPVLVSCFVQCSKQFWRIRRKQHSEMTMFMESESGTCFVLDADDTSLSVSYVENSDNSQLLT